MTRAPGSPPGRLAGSRPSRLARAVTIFVGLGACGGGTEPIWGRPDCTHALSSALSDSHALTVHGLGGASRLSVEAADRKLRTAAEFCGPGPRARLALSTRAALRDSAARATRTPEDLRVALSCWADLDSPGAPPEESARSLLRRADLALALDHRAEGFALLSQLTRRHPETPEGARATRALALLAPLAPEPASPSQAAVRPEPRPEPRKEVDFPGRVIDPARLGILFRATGDRPARLTRVQRWSTADFARMVLSFSEPVRYEQGLLPREGGRPARLYLDFPSTVLSPRIGRAHTVESHLVHGLRLGNHTPTRARMVADLAAPLRFEIYPLVEPYRVVVDLWRQGTSPLAARSASGVSAPLPVRLVALDPGHGGSEKGAVGPAGTLEKDVTLAVAREVARELGRGGLKAVLTRDSDQGLTLEERTALALTAGADLFVSIHANAEPTGTHWGVETYYLDVEGEEYPTRLASREERAAAKAVSPERLLAADLTTRATTALSKRLAESVQGGLVTEARRARPGVPDRGTRPGIFHVLVTARMPAILTEIAFLSHPEEEAALGDPAYQRRLAAGIARGILAHARSGPVPKAPQGPRRATPAPRPSTPPRRL